MKQFLGLLTIALIVLTGCSKASGDPEKDGRKLAEELVECAKKKDYKKANEILGDYVETYTKIYKDGDYDEVSDFFDEYESAISEIKDDMDEKDIEKIRKFFDSEKFGKLSNVKKLDKLYRKALNKKYRNDMDDSVDSTPYYDESAPAEYEAPAEYPTEESVEYEAVEAEGVPVIDYSEDYDYNY